MKPEVRTSGTSRVSEDWCRHRDDRRFPGHWDKLVGRRRYRQFLLMEEVASLKGHQQAA